MVPGQTVELVSGTPLTQLTDRPSPSFSGEPAGLSVSGNVVAMPAPADASSPLARLDLDVGTALVICRQTSETNHGFCFGRYNGSGTPTWAVGLHGGSFKGPRVQWGSYSFIPSSVMLAPLRTNVIAVTGDGTTAKAYANGRLAASGSHTTGTKEYSPINNRQVFMGPLAGPLNATNTRPALGLLWDRALTADEVAQVSANPWALFEAERMAWLPTLSGGGGDPIEGVYGRADEAAAALAMTARLRAAYGLAIEGDAGLAPSARLRAAYALAAEVNAAQALAPGGLVVGVAIEADMALAPAARLLASYGLATEEALALAPAARLMAQLAAGASADVAVAPGALLRASYGLAVEADRALGATPPGSGGGAGAAEVWAYELSNGLTAEQTLVQIHQLLRELHRIHGLELGSPLVSTPTSYSAGDIEQVIAVAGDVVTLTRRP